MNKASDLPTRSTCSESTRLIHAGWILAMLILTSAYSSALYSLLTVPEFESPIDTMQDFIRSIHRRDKGQQKLIVNYARSVYLEQFIHPQPGNRLFEKIGRHLNRTGVKTFEFEHISGEIDRNPRYVALMARIFVKTQIRLKGLSGIHIGQENLRPDFISVLFPKGSRLKKPFDKM